MGAVWPRGGMWWWLQGLALVFLGPPGVWAQAPCSSYSTRCPVTLGISYGSPWVKTTQSEAQYFQVHVVPKLVASEVILSVAYGALDMYATGDGREPTPTDYDWGTQGGQGSPARDVLSLDNWTVPAAGTTLNVLVEASRDSQYRLLINSASVPASLQSGLPQKYWVPKGGSATFKYALGNTVSGAGSFLVSLTPLNSGGGSLSVTQGAQSWAPDSSSGGQHVVVPYTTADKGAAYQVTVSTNGTSNGPMGFTLCAADLSNEQAPTQLLGGVQLDFVVGQHNESYFVLDVPAGEADVNVYLGVIVGDPNLYVQNSSFYHFDPATAANIPWSSHHWSGDEMVTISSDDPGFMHQGGRYYITVRGRQEVNEFSISAYASGTLLSLREGAPLVDAVPDGGYHYYQFYDSDPSQDVLVVMTPFGGDPDIFISCSLNMTGDDSGFPSQKLGHFSYLSRGFSDDTVDISHADNKSCVGPGGHGTFYIGVYGFEAARYSLLVLHRGGTQTLRLGTPQLSTVYPGVTDHYRLRMGPSPESLTITLTAQQGDPDLYVSTDGEEASLSHYQYSSMELHSLTDQVSLYPSELCVECWVSVGVSSFLHPATYTLLATVNTTMTTLQPGRPSFGKVGPGGFAYYKVTSPSACNMTVTVTHLSGVAVMYVSLDQPYFDQGRHNPNVSAVTTDIGANMVPQATLPLMAGETAFIAVTSPESAGAPAGNDSTNVTATAATFTLLVHLWEEGGGPALWDDLDVLVLGQPQDNVVAAGGYNHYQVMLDAGHGHLDFAATPRIGDVELYVNRCPESVTLSCAGELPVAGAANYTSASAASAQQRTVHIDRADEEVTYYVIGVRGAGTGSSHYALNAKEAATSMTLVPNKAVRDHVSKGEYSYFRAAVAQPNTAVTIAVTPETGDPDLYVSINFTHPNQSNYTWTSKESGADTVTISPEDPMYCSDCIYNIAVYGYQESYFSIMVNERGGTATILRDGVPQTDFVMFGSYNYYEFLFDGSSSSDVKIRLSPSYGDPDLYVTIDGSKPSRTSNQYKSSTWWTSDEEVVIRPTDALFDEHCAAQSCHVQMAVFGFILSEYTLTVTTEAAATTLQSNKAFQGLVAAGRYEHFDIPVYSPADVSITVTPLSGTSVLYLSCGAGIPFPNETSHQWVMSLGGMGGSSITLTQQSALAWNCSAPTTYHASVYGQTLSSFSIVASQAAADNGTADENLPVLVPGLSMSGHVGLHEFSYYKVKRGAGPNEGLKIVVTVEVGDVDLYLSADWETRPKWDALAEQVVDFLDSSAALVSPLESLDVAAGDERVCPGGASVACYFIIGVVGQRERINAVGSVYKVVVTSEATVLRLQDGVPIQDAGNAGEYKYYAISVIDGSADLTISLTPFTGDADLYVSPGVAYMQPDQHNFTWASINFGGDTLVLQAQAMSAHCTPDPVMGEPCDYYLGVFAWTNTTYSLMATLNRGWEQPQVLLVGQPQSGFVDAGAFSYYQIQLADSPTLVVTVTPTDGGDQDVYITNSREREPGPMDYDARSNSWIGSDVVMLRPGAKGYCSDCTVYIAVYGYTDGHFSIVASSGLTRLQAGLPQQGTVGPLQSQFYSLHNPANSYAGIQLSLTAMTGDPDLYVLVGNGSALPGPEAFTWASVTSGDDSFTISPGDEDYCQDCDYLVGVYGWLNSTFTLSFQLNADEVTQLVHGRPQSGALTAGKVRLYMVILANSAADLKLTLTTVTGSADLYVGDAAIVDVIDPANSTTYNYTTKDESRNVLLIPGPHSTNVQYLVGVHALTDTSYSIMASFSQLPVVLQSGIPQRQAVAGQQPEVFAFLVDQPTEDVQITVTAVSGDPDVFVGLGMIPMCEVNSVGYMCSNWTWASTQFNTDTIFVDHANPCVAGPNSATMVVSDSCTDASFGPGTLYISVYGYSDSQFTITALLEGKHVSLVSGMPQHGATSPTVLCADRNDDGSCSPASARQHVQAAFYTYQVSGGDIDVNTHVSISVLPECNLTLADSSVTAAPADCPVGCPCNPLTVYVKSCLKSDCTLTDQYPMSGNADIQRSVDSTHPTMFIADDPSNPHNGFCLPHGTDACVYYLAVVGDASESSKFLVTASTPHGVTVLPCKDPKGVPDGLVVTALDVVNGGGAVAQKNYELCAVVGDSFKVSLEVCYGALQLVLCDDNCQGLYPTISQYRYYADGAETCILDPATGKTDCVQLDSESYPYHEPSFIVEAARVDTMFVGVASQSSGSGSYYLKVESVVDGQGTAPVLAPSTAKTGPPGGLTIKPMGPTEALVGWGDAVLSMKGETRVCGLACHYTVYAIPSDLASGASKTACGLEHFAAANSQAVLSQAWTSAGQMQLTVTGLAAEAQYDFVVVARCDWGCLQTLLPAFCQPGAYACQTQVVVYPTSQATTTAAESPTLAQRAAKSTLRILLIAGAAAGGVFLVIGLAYRRHRKAKAQQQYELTDLGQGTFTLSKPVGVDRPRGSHRPLLSADPDMDVDEFEETDGSVLI